MARARLAAYAALMVVLLIIMLVPDRRRWGWVRAITNVNARYLFLVLIVVAKHSRGDDILHFNGLAKRSPFLAFGMLTAMLSLAGAGAGRATRPRPPRPRWRARTRTGTCCSPPR